MTTEALLIKRLDEVESTIRGLETILRVLCDEAHALRVSYGVKPHDEWFDLITETNDKVIKQTYNW